MVILFIGESQEVGRAKAKNSYRRLGRKGLILDNGRHKTGGEKPEPVRDINAERRVRKKLHSGERSK